MVVAKKRSVTSAGNPKKTGTKKPSSPKASSKKSATTPLKSSGGMMKKKLQKTFSHDMTQGKHLVIVESPAKAKTIKSFLGKDVIVQASYGHVADLPQKSMGVAITSGFLPTYEISPEKKKVISTLAAAVKDADGVWLATDEDREGEAIARHLAQALGLPEETTPRIVFHEITKEAIQKAIQTPRHIDMHLVDAQQARRVLDRVVGFSLSPILRTKIKRGLSAGRVQSVAVKLLVEREREIQAFVPEESRKIFAHIQREKKEYRVGLAKVHGKEPILPTIQKVADLFAEYSLSLSQDVLTKSHPLDQAPYEISLSAQHNFVLHDIITKHVKKSPSAPFITSSLQQEASRRFGRGVRQVMMVAQKLYESGYITYMRTDSTNLSQLALQAAKSYVVTTYGADYYTARVYKSASKNAQEAHEAIRPTALNRTPEKCGLSGQELLLYRLIWQRTVASQMASAQIQQTIYHFTPESHTDHIRTMQGDVVTFQGFLALYGKQEEETEDDDNNNDSSEKATKTLPAIPKNTICPSSSFLAQQYFSKPPARYSESALVKALESRGIGRPSTYAPTIATIQERGYIGKSDDKKLYPLDIAFHVTDYLQSHFSSLMNYEFTADMEKKLDDIALGETQWQDAMQEFYTPFDMLLQQAKKGEKHVALVGRKCPTCKEGDLVYKFTATGKFIGCNRYPECTYTEKTEEEHNALSPLQEKYEGKPCPEGGTIVVKMGRFGPFLTSSLYPQVKWISSIPDETREALQNTYGGGVCPTCGKGTLVVKKARRGNYFLACTQYPTCTHAENIPGQPGNTAGGSKKSSFKKKSPASRSSKRKSPVKK